MTPTFKKQALNIINDLTPLYLLTFAAVLE